MASRRRFRPRPQSDEPGRDTGTKQRRPCGLAVQPRRRSASETGRRGAPFGATRALWSRQSRKASGGGLWASVPQTDTGGRGEQPQVGE